MEYWYLVAATDRDAAATADWPGGPFGDLTPERAEVVLASPVRGPQFSQELAQLGKLLLGWRHDLESGEHKLAVSSQGQLAVVSKVPADLVTALAALAEADIDDGLAERWSAAAYLASPRQARPYLVDLRRLSALAVTTGAGLYSFAHT